MLDRPPAPPPAPRRRPASPPSSPRSASPCSPSAARPTSSSTTAARSTATSSRSRSSASAPGRRLELRGGTAPELFERLRSEGADTPADLLVTTDLANLWRAEQAGLLAAGAFGPRSTAQVPGEYRDPRGMWYGLIAAHPHADALDASASRAGAITSYESLGNARFKGRLCLRTSNNEYNQSLVADMLAKRGRARTERLLRSWMANDPRILGSDVDVLEAIAAGRCDAGLTNHYYLGRILADDPSFPVAPAWPDQDGAGAHTNLSGVGVVRGSQHRAAAVALIESLTSHPAQVHITENSELAVDSRRARGRAHPRLVARQARSDRRGERRPPAARRRRADAARRVAVVEARAARRRRPPAWTVLGTLVALLVAGPLAGLPLSFVTDPGAFGGDRRRPAAGGPARSVVLGRRRRRGHARCSAARSRRSCRSTTSRAAAGSTGRSCSRSRCRATCSCSSCSASTTPPARCSAASGACSARASSCRRSARRRARSRC